MTDYHLEYQKGPERCGSILSEVEMCLSGLATGATILDLGCGQGRDAVVAARLGHTVIAVDIAQSGLDQLRAVAKADALPIETVRADIREFATTAEFDLVILDRVLHLLGGGEAINSLLSRVANWTRPRGLVLVADTKKNRVAIRAHFQTAGWIPELQRRDLLITRKPSDNGEQLEDIQSARALRIPAIPAELDESNLTNLARHCSP